MAHESRTIACFQCGGHVELTARAPAGRCPYCGVGLRLNEESRPVAAHFERSGQELLGREALARRQAAMHARAARLNGPMIALALLFALVIAWWLIAGLSGVAGVVPIAVNSALLVFSVATIVGLGRVWASMMKAPDDLELGAVGLAGCGNCGAFIVFEQGEAVAACSYCRASALQPATLAYELLKSGREGLRRGQEQHAEAEAENWRTAREARIGRLRMGVGGWVAVAMVVAFAMTGVLLYLLIDAPSQRHATWWIWPTLVGATGLAGRSVVRSVKGLMADNEVFERRFGVDIRAGQDVYGPRRS